MEKVSGTPGLRAPKDPMGKQVASSAGVTGLGDRGVNFVRVGWGTVSPLPVPEASAARSTPRSQEGAATEGLAGLLRAGGEEGPEGPE